jgi:hypothetical protein
VSQVYVPDSLVAVGKALGSLLVNATLIVLVVVAYDHWRRPGPPAPPTPPPAPKPEPTPPKPEPRPFPSTRAEPARPEVRTYVAGVDLPPGRYDLGNLTLRIVPRSR